MHKKDRGDVNTISEWAQNMLSKQAQIWEIARQNQKKNNSHQMLQASPKRTEYPVIRMCCTSTGKDPQRS